MITCTLVDETFFSVMPVYNTSSFLHVHQYCTHAPFMALRPKVFASHLVVSHKLDAENESVVFVSRGAKEGVELTFQDAQKIFGPAKG